MPYRSLVIGPVAVLAQSVDAWWKLVGVEVSFLGAEETVPQVIYMTGSRI